MSLALSPVLALRVAIRAHCAGDAALAELMSVAIRLYDEPPRGAEPVYALFGPCKLTDWSTSSDRGHEQALTIVVWAAPGSAASGLRAADRLSALLDDAPLALAGHRLVNLAVIGLDSERDDKAGLARTTLRLRASPKSRPDQFTGDHNGCSEGQGPARQAFGRRRWVRRGGGSAHAADRVQCRDSGRH